MKNLKNFELSDEIMAQIFGGTGTVYSDPLSYHQPIHERPDDGKNTPGENDDILPK